MVLFLNQFSHYYVFLYHFVCFIFVHAAFVRIKLMMMMINDGQQAASQCGLDCPAVSAANAGVQRVNRPPAVICRMITAHESGMSLSKVAATRCYERFGSPSNAKFYGST